jgi:serine/threonine protein kinase
VALIGASGFVGDLLGFSFVPQPLAIAIPYLAQKTLWLTIACAVVVYGAYRIEILRDQAERYRELGQYRLREALGAGGMGEVYLAEHRLLRRTCAIKLIRPERAGDPENLARFEREVQATATLTHPNTIQVYDYGRAEDGTFYYAMEYLPGVTLEQLVNEHGPLPAPRAIHLLRQVCGALGEAHAIGLIHRDIKPSNVMVCDRGRIRDVAKLLDFGLVMPQRDLSESERLTQEGSIAGTPAYMSPEQAEGRTDLDCRSDIYSLGALAYFTLTGQSPFAGRSAMKTLAAHLYETPEPLTKLRGDIPIDLQEIVLRCLSKRARERYESADLFELALGRCGTAGDWSAADAAAWWRSRSGGLTHPNAVSTEAVEGLTTC